MRLYIVPALGYSNISAGTHNRHPILYSARTRNPFPHCLFYEQVSRSTWANPNSQVNVLTANGSADLYIDDFMLVSNKFQEKISDPILALLKQGLSPKSIASSLAFGAVIGLFPILGTTTAICIFVAAAFRLNQIAIQIANYAVYPLQIILLIPFIRLGEYIFQIKTVTGNPQEIISLARMDIFLVLKTYGISLISGCFAWFICAVPCILCLKFIFHYVIKNIPSHLFVK